MDPTKDSIDPTPINNCLGLPTIVVERFMAMIARTMDQLHPLLPARPFRDGCWIWLGAETSTGYGQYRFGEQGSSPWKAHRLSYALTYGKIRRGLHVHHKCRQTLCVNPLHLQVTTPRNHVVNLTPGSGPYKASRATHCVHGHEFSSKNTRIYQAQK
jgi:hypothetical protein